MTSVEATAAVYETRTTKEAPVVIENEGWFDEWWTEAFGTFFVKPDRSKGEKHFSRYMTYFVNLPLAVMATYSVWFYFTQL